MPEEPKTKTFPTDIILTLATGRGCRESMEIRDFHEAAEWLMGHPIWTHHFGDPDEPIWPKLRAAVLKQQPNFPTTLPRGDLNKFRRAVEDVVATWGETMMVLKGDGSTERSPLAGMPFGKPVVAISVSEG